MRRWLAFALILVLAPPLTAGSRHLKDWGGDHMRVDGVKLEHRRTVELRADRPEDNLLEIESALGDLEIRGVRGDALRLTVEIYEYEPGDLTLELRRGRIVLNSAGDHPGAVGAVVAEVPLDMDLELTTGYGDVDIEDMDGCSELVVETGLGDVTATGLERVEDIEIATGKGDIRLGPAREIGMAELATGMGGIKVREAEVDEIDASSGMGGIQFLDCELGLVTGGTGMGKIKFRNTDYDRSDISSGFGGVHRD